MSRVIETVENVYRFFFLRKWAYGLNQMLFQLSIRGLGIMNYENNNLSGEKSFLKSVCEKYSDRFICLDVGANIGKYSSKVKSMNPQSEVYAFEPHPNTFKKLANDAEKYNYKVFNLGLSDVEGKLELYDYQEKNGSTHASLYKDVIEDIHNQDSIHLTVDITTVDNFVEENEIVKINLLKIDVEGNELKVIMGAKKQIENQKIDIIHFEFNEMNVISGTFLKNVIDNLPGYNIFRMLPYGLVKLNYKPLNCEVFAYQNIVAIRDSLETDQLDVLQLN